MLIASRPGQLLVQGNGAGTLATPLGDSYADPQICGQPILGIRLFESPVDGDDEPSTVPFNAIELTIFDFCSATTQLPARPFLAGICLSLNVIIFDEVERKFTVTYPGFPRIS